MSQQAMADAVEIAQLFGVTTVDLLGRRMAAAGKRGPHTQAATTDRTIVPAAQGQAESRYEDDRWRARSVEPVTAVIRGLLALLRMEL